MNAALPIALTIAGSDPSGGAGIQADLKTFTMLSAYGASVITALTAQNTLGVTGVMTVPPDFIKAQFDAVAADLQIGAVKTGMLADAATVETVAGCLARLEGTAIVVDPVMIATSGDRLIDTAAVEVMIERLIPLATVITPNLPEAAALLGIPPARNEAEMEAQAEALLEYGCQAVLMKDGHGTGDEAVDIFRTRTHRARFARPRIETRNTHGTGCTMAAAIAARLAHGETLPLAIEIAKSFVWEALMSAASLKIGSGNGPVDHLFSVHK